MNGSEDENEIARDEGDAVEAGVSHVVQFLLECTRRVSVLGLGLCSLSGCSPDASGIVVKTTKRSTCLAAGGDFHLYSAISVAGFRFSLSNHHRYVFEETVSPW